ncbi:MAG: penicillin-binding transpeptidase domain-containing protein [Tissierellaceae bacterium]|nr:penicillin-binding transpeptidase domain-containing protein [Tissierellaceae bacterium]
MKLIDKIKNRYNILTFLFVIMVAALSLRLATLTIAQGDYYRDLSDNKRLKEVYVTAPRGEIRDRYGRLLAGNKPSFTVQLLKDELNRLDTDRKNEAFLSLIRLLEEDGVSYVDEIPLQLNVFKYKSEEDYQEETIDPIEKVIQIIIENNLVSDVLDSYYLHPNYPEHFKFITVNKAINALQSKGIDVNIDAKIIEGEVILEFNGKADSDIKLTPKQVLENHIKEDETLLRKMVDHSVSRKLVYDILIENNLADNIILEDVSISYKEDFLKQKRSLNKMFPSVTLETSAKEDFVNIAIDSSLKGFLEKSIAQEDETRLIPGKILLDMIKEKGVQVPIEVELGEDGVSVMYSYSGNKDIGDDSLVDLLIEYGEEAEVLSDFITSDNIKYQIQSQLLNNGINPRISIAKEFQYVDINNLIAFYTANNIPEDSSNEEVFELLRENYGIDEDLSNYEARKILIIHNQLKKQGYLAYSPINIAYGIKDSTVAKVEEILVDIPGIGVSVEPVRYYPEGSSAAHILGYLGKISQTNEIKKYVEELNYSPNALIGKTGIEESFESELKGINGIKRVEVDSLGNTTDVLDEVKSIPGNNIYLSIDLKLQKVAEEALAQTLDQISKGGTYESQWGNYSYGINNRKRRPYIANSGAVVAIDVKTGQVLASVSYPSYDPNLFSTGISNTDWESLFPENENDQLAPRPLYNIVTQTAVQPGSVYKMVTGLTALEKGLSPTLKIQDMGRVDIGSSQFRCLIWTNSGRTHGWENLYEAIRDSCNYYFYTLALGYNQKTGADIGVQISIEDIAQMSKKLGLNDRTGIEINIPYEVSGGVPDPQRKVINTKAMLKSYLNRNIEKYFKEDFIYDNEYKQEVINEITSWIEYEEPLTRGEVVNRLEDLGLNAEVRLPGEREGIADKIKYTYINFAGWNITDTLNVTIGQGANAYTPIQMANSIAIMANGGYKHKLTLVDNVKNYNNSKTLYTHEVNPERIELNDYENLDHVKLGMKMVSEDGTARRVFQNFPVDVGVKTGTAEKSGINPSTGDTYDDFAWFVGFAPYDDPEIAIAAVLFQGGTGGYAGPMVRDIMAEYLGLNDTNVDDSLPYDSFITK